MKKRVLLLSLAICNLTFAQQLDSLNEPAIGASQLMHSCFELTPNLNSIVGNTAQWDYSQAYGLSQTQLLEVIDPSTTANSSDFLGATKAMRIENSITNYFSSSANERISQGFFFEEPNFGAIIAKYDTDAQTTMEYPFAFGNTVSDVFSGSLEFEFNGTPQTPDFDGNSIATIDGQGTLKLPDGSILQNVIRYKLVDTIFSQVSFIIPIDIEIIRNQYEYYHSSSTLPVFIHASLAVYQQTSATPVLEQTVVLSSVEPTNKVSVSTIEQIDFTVFPNPSNGSIQCTGDFAEDATVTVLDPSGRVVVASKSIYSGESIDLTHLQNGVYHLIIESKGYRNTQKINIQ